jgi:uncharacterized membrane protein
MPNYLIIIFVFTVIGILDTLYLVYHSIKKTPVTCLFFPKEWCEKVQYSKYSKMFGIPNSILGLSMYLAILLLAILQLYGIGNFVWLQIVVGFGFLFSAYFTFIQAFVLRAFCTWCVVSAINFIMLAIATFILA